MPFVETISWFLFSGLLVWAALSDGRTLTIPNRLCLAVALLYITRLPIVGPVDWVIGLGLGFGGLLAGFIAFERGWIGGGDAKLIAAVLPWAGITEAGGFLLVTALTGGVLALAILIRHRGPFLLRMMTGRAFLSEPPAQTSAEPPAQTSAEAPEDGTQGATRDGSAAIPGLPYGIAIAAGGLWLAAQDTLVAFNSF
jgi:Flp pilus assembly protein protease CpaA